MRTRQELADAAGRGRPAAGRPRTSQADRPQTGATPAMKRKVLVVDDDLAIVEVLEMRLAGHGLRGHGHLGRRAGPRLGGQHALRPGARRPAHGAHRRHRADGGGARSPAAPARADHDGARHHRDGGRRRAARRLRLPDQAVPARRAARQDRPGAGQPPLGARPGAPARRGPDAGVIGQSWPACSTRWPRARWRRPRPSAASCSSRSTGVWCRWPARARRRPSWPALEAAASAGDGQGRAGDLSGQRRLAPSWPPRWSCSGDRPARW